MVSARADANRLSLGQVATEEKSNEITAIPKLLDLLEIKGCIVTIDRHQGENLSRERRYYIVTFADDTEVFANAVRATAFAVGVGRRADGSRLLGWRSRDLSLAACA